MIEPELLVAACRADGTILFRNPAWIRTLGEDGDLWLQLYEEDSKIAKQNFKEAAGGSLVTNAVFMVRRPERDLPLPALLQFIPVPIPSSGRDERSERVIMITGEILAEPVSWTENQTAKHRMETLGRMTMGIAHDFNNLLAGILGHIELIRSQSSVDPGLAEHLDTIERAAGDGSALVNKIQRYIRQETQASFEAIDLTGLIQDCVTLTKPYWYNEPRRQGIAIDLQYSPVELPLILGSPSELRDVFVNLILNAVQALPQGGGIRIDCAREGKTVRITVSDDGVGMSEHVRERIFEPLFTTKGGRGSGMGLTVASGVVHEHDGTIHVQSELGRGTTFTLTFPASSTRASTAPVLDGERAGRPASVLVVDDEEMVRSVIDRLLTLRGHTVCAVGSALKALDELAKRPFDVVISDQGMPEMSGRELAHKIRGLYPELPVILLTGDTDLTVDPADIAGVVTKPFQLSDLEGAIQRVI